MAVNIKIIFFWDVITCSLIQRDQSFGGTYCFHILHESYRQQVPLRQWYLSIELHGIISQMTTIPVCDFQYLTIFPKSLVHHTTKFRKQNKCTSHTLKLHLANCEEPCSTVIVHIIPLQATDNIKIANCFENLNVFMRKKSRHYLLSGHTYEVYSSGQQNIVMI
jgi:hypothetical protein